MKKLLLSIGTLSIIATPVVALVSCSQDAKIEPEKHNPYIEPIKPKVEPLKLEDIENSFQSLEALLMLIEDPENNERIKNDFKELSSKDFKNFVSSFSVETTQKLLSIILDHKTSKFNIILNDIFVFVEDKITHNILNLVIGIITGLDDDFIDGIIDGISNMEFTPQGIYDFILSLFANFGEKINGIISNAGVTSSTMLKVELFISKLLKEFDGTMDLSPEIQSIIGGDIEWDSDAFKSLTKWLETEAENEETSSTSLKSVNGLFNVSAKFVSDILTSIISKSPINIDVPLLLKTILPRFLSLIYPSSKGISSQEIEMIATSLLNGDLGKYETLEKIINIFAPGFLDKSLLSLADMDLPGFDQTLGDLLRGILLNGKITITGDGFAANVAKGILKEPATILEPFINIFLPQLKEVLANGFEDDKTNVVDKWKLLIGKLNTTIHTLFDLKISIPKALSTAFDIDRELSVLSEIAKPLLPTIKLIRKIFEGLNINSDLVADTMYNIIQGRLSEISSESFQVILDAILIGLGKPKIAGLGDVFYNLLNGNDFSYVDYIAVLNLLYDGGLIPNNWDDGARKLVSDLIAIFMIGPNGMNSIKVNPIDNADIDELPLSVFDVKTDFNEKVINIKKLNSLIYKVFPNDAMEIEVLLENYNRAKNYPESWVGDDVATCIEKVIKKIKLTINLLYDKFLDENETILKSNTIITSLIDEDFSKIKALYDATMSKKRISDIENIITFTNENFNQPLKDFLDREHISYDDVSIEKIIKLVQDTIEKNAKQIDTSTIWVDNENDNNHLSTSSQNLIKFIDENANDIFVITPDWSEIKKKTGLDSLVTIANISLNNLPLDLQLKLQDGSIESVIYLFHESLDSTTFNTLDKFIFSKLLNESTSEVLLTEAKKTSKNIIDTFAQKYPNQKFDIDVLKQDIDELDTIAKVNEFINKIVDLAEIKKYKFWLSDLDSLPLNLKDIYQSRLDKEFYNSEKLSDFKDFVNKVIELKKIIDHLAINLEVESSVVDDYNLELLNSENINDIEILGDKVNQKIESLKD